MRGFSSYSHLNQGTLALALAPAQTPIGVEHHPLFFQGTAVYPQVLARGLLVLADITATRYFNYVPVTDRDPILSAQGNVLRAECFSACNGVYARLDLLQSGFEGQIAHGTTNIDIGPELKSALTKIKKDDQLFVKVGDDGLNAQPIEHNKQSNVIKMAEAIHERSVQMPDRWVRALGNTALIHQTMQTSFSLDQRQSMLFIGSLPHATSKNQEGWLTLTPQGVKLLPIQTKGAVYISGLHRLSALKRIMKNIQGITFYQPNEQSSGEFMLQVDLLGARLTLSLTACSWRGYSGEGALLSSLAEAVTQEDAESIYSMLTFDAVINEAKLAQQLKIDNQRLQTALSLLAVNGKLGYDAHEKAYFHRELPNDPNRIHRDNPRLIAAQKLVEQVKKHSETEWFVTSKEVDYRVNYDPIRSIEQASCTCTWYLKHQNDRGPCKHILAVQLKENL